MAGIYGDFLDFFPELFDTVSFCSVEPRIGAGYDIQFDGVTDAIVMTEKDFALKIGRNVRTDSNDILSFNDKEYLFAPSGSPLKVGFFIKHPENGLIYTLIGKAGWEKEAGFTKFEIEVMPGPDGSEAEVKPEMGLF